MGCDTNLPPMVHIYLELLRELMKLSDDIDSSFPESVLAQKEVAYYLALIREEMAAMKKEQTPVADGDE